MESRAAFAWGRQAACLSALAIVASGCARQAGRESAPPLRRPAGAGATAPSPAAAAEASVERLAEWCVDAQMLVLGCRSGRYKLPYWVASRTASLDCSLGLRWAIASVDICGEDLRSGNQELIRLTVGNLANQIRAANKLMGESTAKDPKSALTGTVLFALVGPEKVTAGSESMYAQANRDEARWLAATEAGLDKLVIQQARRLAPLLTEPSFVAGREQQIQAAVKALRAAPEEERQLRGALKLPDELVKARAAYCQRLTRADAAAR